MTLLGAPGSMALADRLTVERESRLRQREGKLTVAGVVFLYVSLQLHGLFEIPVGEVAIAPWNLAGVVLVLWTLLNVLMRRATFRKSALLAPATLGYLALTGWMTATAFYSREPGAALAVVAVQMLNCAVLVSLGSMTLSAERLRALNRTLYVLGVTFAVIALILFIPPWMAYPHLPAKEGWGYVLDRGLALRMKGLTRDPNFFALYTGIAFLMAISGKDLPYRKLGIPILGAALLLALSRTFLAAVVVAVLATGAAAALTRRSGARRYLAWVGPGVVTVTFLFLALLVASPEFLDFFRARLNSIGSQSRIPHWIQAWGLLKDPLFGEGLRSINAALGHFSHNTWLDVFVELGLVGIITWFWFVGATLIGWIRLLGSKEAVPWFQIWVATLAMSSAFSLLYNPIFVLIAGVMVSRTSFLAVHEGPAET